MRMSQYRGLNAWSSKLVSRKQKVREHGVQVFANGKRKNFSRWRRVPLVRKEDAGLIRGMGGEAFAKLHRYTLADGRKLSEFIQAEIWSGGPVYFIALKDESGKPIAESLWSEEELAGA